MIAAVEKAGEHVIKPRKMAFDFGKVKEKYWFDGNTILTTLFAAMSATFPPGEANFIESVRHYRDQITDPKLKKQISGFIGQEGHHSHQHKHANEALDELGLYATRLEKHLERDIARLDGKVSPAFNLAMTVAMEHVTAIMAEYALTEPSMTEPMSAEMRELILWHAVEEIEHKAVAYDVFEQCVGDRKMLSRAMIIVSVEFSLRIMAYQTALLYWDRKLPSVRDVVGAAKFIFGKKGLVRSVAKPYMTFFEKDFHPWKHNNMALIDAWKAKNEEKAA